MILELQTGIALQPMLPVHIRIILLFITSLAFILAASGRSAAEACLQSSLLFSAMLLIADFIASFFALSPFGVHIDQISWLFFWSIAWLGLLRWQRLEEIPFEGPAEIASQVTHRCPDLPGINFIDDLMLKGWYLAFFMFVIPLIGTSLMIDRYWSRPDRFIGKFLLCWFLLALLAWAFVAWKKSFERRTAGLFCPVSKNGREAENNPSQSMPSSSEWAYEELVLVVEIPTRLGTMTTLICAISFVLLLTLNRSGIPVWLRNDLMIAFAITLFIKIFLKNQYLIDLSGRKIHQEFTNPLYYRKRQVEFSEVAMITTSGRLSGWPLLWHRYRLDYSVVMILKDGTVLTVPRNAEGKRRFFVSQEDTDRQAEYLARFIGCEFRPGLFRQNESFADWQADVDRMTAGLPDQEALRLALWQTKFSNVSLEVFEPGVVKVDLPTLTEKLVLCLLVLFFIVSTQWIISREGSVIAANPRLIYLFLLDSTSVLVTLYAAWVWLVDEYYVFDFKKRQISFRSRLLFWRREKVISTFNQISRFELWKRYSWFAMTNSSRRDRPVLAADQYFVRMKGLDGKFYSMSDGISLNYYIPAVRAGALSKMVFSGPLSCGPMPATGLDMLDYSSVGRKVDANVSDAGSAISATPSEAKKQKKKMRRR